MIYRAASALAALLAVGGAGFHLMASRAAEPSAPAEPPTVMLDGNVLRGEEAKLHRRFASGEADPVADAVRAARNGDFRLIWGAGSFAFPIGIVCNGPIPRASLVQRTVSDVITDRPQADYDRYLRQLDAYAPVYNRTLVDQPAFPAPDVCRPATPEDSSRTPVTDYRLYAQPARPAAGPLHDLHEAARRGGPSEIRSWLARGSIEAADMFGYTPLAWAVLRDRPDAVALLLAAGARPYATDRDVRLRQTPIWLGIRLGRRESVRLMLQRLPEGVLEVDADLMQAAVEGGDPHLVRSLARRMTDETYPEAAFEAALKADRRDLVRILLASGAPTAADALLSAAARTGSLWAARLALSKGAEPHAPSQPLGQAILGEHEADEAIFEALLAAGADVNRTTVGASMSGPPLRIAVTHARRGPFSDASDRQTGERQQRIILRLLRAGARDPTRFPEQRPLAFVAVIGWNAGGAPTPGADAQPLPTPILEALVKAGMDLNQPFKGRTVLDWVEAADPGSPLIGTLRALGARRSADIPSV